MPLDSFGQSLTIAVVGASGAIGSAFVTRLANDPAVSKILAFSRSPVVFGQRAVETSKIDLDDPTSIQAAVEYASNNAPYDLVLIASGLLHTDTIRPEKSLRQLGYESMAAVVSANTIGPACVMAGFLPLMRRESKSAVAAISARVGSISDNQLGGWVSYRASKAALNMVVKTFSIEQKRANPNCVIAALQPGTVDSPLSAPFNTRVPPDKLFTPEYSAARMLDVIDRLSPSDSGGFYAWDGSSIHY